MGQLFLPVLPDHQLDASFCTSDSSQSSYTLQDEHMLISISGCPSPRYFPRNPLSHFSQAKDPYPPTSLSLTLPPDLRLPGSAPCLLPSWHSLSSRSLVKLVLRASFFYLFFFLTAMDYSWNFLVSLAPCPCSFSSCSSFSIPSMLTVPTPTGPFFIPVHHVLAWPVQNLESLSALPPFFNSAAPLKPHFSSHPEM